MLINKNSSGSIQLADLISRLYNNCQTKDAFHKTKYGISIVGFRCMRILSECNELSANQLAQRMSLTNSRITRIIDGLEKKNLVKRISSKNDRRIYILSLSSEGRKLTKEMIENYIKIHNDIFSALSPEYQQPMIDLLSHLNQTMEKWIQKNS